MATLRLRLALLITLIGLGMLLGSEGLGGIEFDDAELAPWIGIAGLVLILFEGGLTTKWADARRRARADTRASGLARSDASQDVEGVPEGWARSTYRSRLREARPNRAMPPASTRLSPFVRPSPPAVAPGGTTTTGQGARRETSAEMLPRSDERGPVEPTTIIAARAFFAAATSASAGWPGSTDQAAPQSAELTLALSRSSRPAIVVTSASAAVSSTARTKTTRKPSSLLRTRATRAAPFADSESSTPQMIEPFTDPPLVASLENGRPPQRAVSGGEPISAPCRPHEPRPASPVDG